MQLLVFAHRGEAQVFLKSLNLSFIETSFGGIYKGDNCFILITGEGLFNASEVTTAALAQFSEISEITNLGICASVNNGLQKLDSLSVRTVYHYDDDYQFKSFTSSDTKAKFDLTSVSKRLTQKTDKEKISMMSDTFDRELWAVASSAKRFKKPWRSLKVISDILHIDTDCKDIFEDAELFSLKLFEAYKKLEIRKDKGLTETQKILQDLPLYLTFSQQKKCEKLLASYLVHHGSPLEKSEVISLFDKDITPKMKTKSFISFLEKSLNPIDFEVKDRINELFKDSHLNIHYDQNLESQKIKFSGSIENTKELDLLSTEVKNIPFDKFIKILNGKI